ncbi:uncharacterized protein [Prorops nasuta]|uniref:uncharacterized protein n=1 Tax=Prorops nasuta TaxID=863751 RepID=UPI0034CD77EF
MSNNRLHLVLEEDTMENINPAHEKEGPSSHDGTSSGRQRQQCQQLPTPALPSTQPVPPSAPQHEVSGNAGNPPVAAAVAPAPPPPPQVAENPVRQERGRCRRRRADRQLYSRYDDIVGLLYDLAHMRRYGQWWVGGGERWGRRRGRGRGRGGF